MREGDWLPRHRTMVLLVGTILLGVFIPIPGLLLGSLFWPSGIHDLNSTGETLMFLAFIVSVSGLIWFGLLNLVLPRPSPKQ
jgi:hypothetical protein